MRIKSIESRKNLALLFWEFPFLISGACHRPSLFCFTTTGAKEVEYPTLFIMSSMRGNRPRKGRYQPDRETGGMPSDHDNLANHLALQRLRLSKSTNAPTPEQMATRSSEAAVVANRSLKLLAFLESSTKHEIETLDLSNSDLSEEDYVIICVVIENHPTVRRLILEGNRLNEVSLQSIIQACRKNRFLAEIRVDSRQMRLEGMNDLKAQLESNRIFIKQARRRQWLHLERINYDASVQAFCDFMESFFVQELRLRHHVEEQEASQRTQIGELSQEHRRREIFRQRMKRIIEAVHERLLWVIQREAKFRAVIAAEWMSHNINLCLAAEVSHREAEILTEKRVRLEEKTEETKGWVYSRRMEKRRLEDEALARQQLVDEEVVGRDVIFLDGIDYFDRLAPVEQKRREDAQMAEFMRIERERREAMQKRKEAEQLRERREKEEKDRQAKLARFRAEQRKEREKFEGDATVGRKRIMLLRSTFNRFVESFLSTFFSLARIRDDAIRFHAALEHLLLAVPVPTLSFSQNDQEEQQENVFLRPRASLSPVEASILFNSPEWRDSVASTFSSFFSSCRTLRHQLGTEFRSVASFSDAARPSIDGIVLTASIPSVGTQPAISSPTSSTGPPSLPSHTEVSLSNLSGESAREDEDKASLFEALEDEQKSSYFLLGSSIRSLRFRQCASVDDVLGNWIQLRGAELHAQFYGERLDAEGLDEDVFSKIMNSNHGEYCNSSDGDDQSDSFWIRSASITDDQQADDTKRTVFSASTVSKPINVSSGLFAVNCEESSSVPTEADLTLDDVQSTLQDLSDRVMKAATAYRGGVITFRCRLHLSGSDSAVECAGTWP